MTFSLLHCSGQTSCSGCKTCHPNATTYGSCPPGSSKDYINCTCNIGFYGNGTACAPCKSCDANALKIGSCPAGSSSDGINCSCNSGYYGRGTSCTECAIGSYSHQGCRRFLNTAFDSSVASSSVITCCLLGLLMFSVLTIGCLRAGQPNCSSCKRCHPNATTFGVCTAGSASDVVNCTCNAGFYGSGLNCTRCKTCDTNAATHGILTVGSCPTGDLPQGITCSCNAGYAGPGTQCSLCKQGTYSLAGS